MEYKCPRCAKPVVQGAGPLAQHFGLIGALLGMAFASYSCLGCGALARADFPPEVRSGMFWRSVAMVGGALAVATAVIALLVSMN